MAFLHRYLSRLCLLVFLWSPALAAAQPSDDTAESHFLEPGSDHEIGQAQDQAGVEQVETHWLDPEPPPGVQPRGTQQKADDNAPVKGEETENKQQKTKGQQEQKEQEKDTAASRQMFVYIVGAVLALVIVGGVVYFPYHSLK